MKILDPDVTGILPSLTRGNKPSCFCIIPREKRHLEAFAQLPPADSEFTYSGIFRMLLISLDLTDLANHFGIREAVKHTYDCDGLTSNVSSGLAQGLMTTF